MRILTTTLILPLLFSCTNKEYVQETVDNIEFRPNTVFKSYEDLTSPKFRHLVEKYQLDTIVEGETNEFKRILLLRDWIKSKVKIDDYCESYPAKYGDVEGIMDAALAGSGFDCGHFMTVQNAVMNAFGYVTRTLGAGPGVEGGPDGHHGINEIWSNDYGKWFLSDAKYNHHFEKNGMPLSALEIRAEYLKNKAGDIVLAVGANRLQTDFDEIQKISKEDYAQTYTWVEWHVYNNGFTAWPDDNATLIMFNDEFYKNNTWIWNGNLHWTSRHPEYLKLVDDRKAIEWTPNTISSEVSIQGDEALVKLKSETPNFKCYQMKELPAEDWQEVGDSIILELNLDRCEFHFRSVNLKEVAGPIHKIIFKESQVNK